MKVNRTPKEIVEGSVLVWSIDNLLKAYRIMNAFGSYPRSDAPSGDRLVGLVVRRPPRERKIPVRIPLAPGFFRLYDYSGCSPRHPDYVIVHHARVVM